MAAIPPGAQRVHFSVRRQVRKRKVKGLSPFEATMLQKFDSIIKNLKDGFEKQTADLKVELKGVNAKLEGFIGKIAVSNENEVVKAVLRHLNVPESACDFNQVIRGDDLKKICEIDGIVVLPEAVHVIEAKSTVKADALKQLERTVAVYGLKSKVPVRGYIGGPTFDKGVKEEAFRRGFSVVQLSGSRYEVLETGDDVNMSNKFRRSLKR